MRSSNFGKTILGEAVHAAVNNTAAQLEAKAGSMPTKVVTIDGLVADAAPDGTLILNVGSGGREGGRPVRGEARGREITDPATGKVLRSMEDAIGEVTVTEVDAASAVGKFRGSGCAGGGRRR